MVVAQMMRAAPMSEADGWPHHDDPVFVDFQHFFFAGLGHDESVDVGVDGDDGAERRRRYARRFV